VGLFDYEIIDKGTVGEYGLGPYSAPPPFEVAGLYLGYKLLHGPNEGGLAEREIDLLEPGAPVSGGHSPEGRLGDYRPDLGGVQRGDGVALPGPGDHGVGATADYSTLDSAKGRAEEGEARVGDRVDEVADEGTGPGFEGVKLAAEWDEANLGPYTGHSGDTVCVEPGAVDEVAGADRAI